MTTETTSARQILTLLSNLPIIHTQDTVADPRNLPPGNPYILPRNSKPFVFSTSTSTTATSSSDASSAAAAGSQQQQQRHQAQNSRRTVNVQLKPLKPLAGLSTGVLHLEGIASNISIYDLKTLVSQRTGYAASAIKILRSRRPVSESKTIAEVVGEEEVGKGTVEFGGMFSGSPTVGSGVDPSQKEGKSEGGDVKRAKVEDTAARGVHNADTASLEAAKARDTGRAGGVEGGLHEAGTGDVEMVEGGNGTPAQGKSGREVLETEEFWEDLRGFVVQRVRDEEVAGAVVGRMKEGWRGWV